MYYYNNSFGYQSSSSNTDHWDPDTVLHLIHPDRGAYRCTGHAPSKNRRCMNQVASFGSGRAILSSLARKDVSEARESPDLEKAAAFTLCYLHKSQADTVAYQWNRLLRAWARENKNNAGTSRSSKTEADSSSKHKPKTKRESGAPKEEEDFESGESGNFTNEQQESIQDFLKKLNMNTDDLTAILDAIFKDKQRKERAKCEQEAREKEEHEEEQNRKEQAKREKAARDEEERSRKAREEQAAAAKERVRLAREQREKVAREKAAREAEAWAQAWERYTEAWEEIKTVKSEEVSHGSAPFFLPCCVGYTKRFETDTHLSFPRTASPGLSNLDCTWMLTSTT
jgi:hypothetical protein